MLDIIGFDTLLAELILGVGLAMVVGNGLAFVKARRGERPDDMDEAVFNPRRATFLMTAGTLMAVWGIASILSR